MGEGTLTHLATLALVRDRARQMLMVEDNPVNLKVAEKMLERLGCVVTVARDGAQALDLLGEDPYDVILMDCQMPVMDGYESARRIRARSDAHSATPILALTANAMDGDEEKCLRAGMNAHIPKPVTLARLEQELELWAPVACAVPTDGDTDVPEERAAVNG
jgi:CheY-like chemotaxis protein